MHRLDRLGGHGDVELTNGIRLDTTYYYFPAAWITNRPGFLTGSGMPMRFADVDGQIIDVYQATTQMTDESHQLLQQDSATGFTIDTLLDNAIGPKGYYGVFTANMHADLVAHAGSDAITTSALNRGLPVVTARQMLEWLDGRNSASFGGLAWSPATNRLSFTINTGGGANGLQAMLPMESAVGPLGSITRNGSPVGYTTDTIKGLRYAFFTATGGNYEASYTADTTAPLISAVTATANADGTALITWDTNEVSDSSVEYGTSPSSLTLNAVSGALVTSHMVTLTGLAEKATYYYRVRLADPAGNASTSPEAPRTASFATPIAFSFTDTTAADFGLGTLGACTVIARTADPTAGDVIRHRQSTRNSRSSRCPPGGPRPRGTRPEAPP